MVYGQERDYERAEVLYRKAVAVPRSFGGAFLNLMQEQVRNGRPGGLDSTVTAFKARLPGSSDLWQAEWLAVIDNAGHLSAHTGADCIAHAGHVTGEHHSCQANMMARDTVPEAMSAAFKQATGPLQDRLLAALEAAEAEGGDVRGRQSAAMLVVPRGGRAVAADGGPPRGGLPDPLKELKRLLTLQRAYDLAGAADELLAAGRTDEAGELYPSARRSPRTRTSCSSGPASPAPRRVTWTRAWRRWRGAAEATRTG